MLITEFRDLNSEEKTRKKILSQQWHNNKTKIISEYAAASAAAAKSRLLCPTLCDPTDGRPPGSAIPGILQARTLEWVAISFSNAWKWNVKVKSLSRIQLLATPWTAAYQAPPSMGFSRQEYWSGLPLPSLSEYEVYLNTWEWVTQFYEFPVAAEAKYHKLDGSK